MRSNDNFWRESIEGNPPHQAWLNPDHYEEEGSPLRTFLTIGAAVGAVVGGRHAFRQGAMRDIARSFIRAMAGFRPTEADTIMTSLKQWANTPKPWDQYTNIRDKLFAPKGVFGGGLEEAMAQLDKRLQTNRQHLVSRGVAGGKALLSDELDIEAVLREAELATEINARGLSNKNKQRVFQLTRDYLKEYNVYTKEMIAEDINRYGMRRATIADVYNAQGGKGVLFDRSSDTTMHRRALIEKWRVELGDDTLMNKMADPWVFVDETGKLYDLRYWPKVGKSVLNSLETDFGLPFLRFNPLAMFHIGDILNVRSTPKIHLMAPTEIQPSVSGRQTTDKLYLMLGDMLHDVEDAAARPIRGYLIDTKGPGANFLQSITGAGAPRPEDYQYPTTGWRKHWASVTRILDIGHMRKEHYGTHGFDITNFMTDFIAWPADKFWKHMKPYTNQNLWSKRPFGSSFGRPGQVDTETPYLFMRKTRYDNPVDFVKQVFAHRDRTEDITTASVPFYYFFSRLDAALAQFGLGLSAEHRRSGADIFLNMVLRRALPVWGAVEAWKYFNYEAENLTGVRPEELLAEGYKETSIAAAHVRDVLGITDWAKRFKFLLPGGEQISELPLIGRFTDLDKSAEETEEYWESGEDPVRKGRWWFFGNCIHPNTPIQLADGTLLSAKDMQVGYSVLTHTGESHRVLQVIVRKMKISEWAPKIKVHGFPEATITTDNHPYLVVKKKHCPSSRYDNCRPDTPCNLNRPYKQCAKRYEWRADWILAKYVEPGDFLAYPRFKMTGSITVIDGIPLNIETGYLVGIILAEGHINKWYHGKGYQIETTHNVTERDIVEKLDDIVNRYFGVSGTVRVAGKGGTLKYRICSKKVAGWIQGFLYRGREKLFPGGIQNYPEDFAIGIVKGMFEGDGHISKNGKDSFQLCLTAKRMNHIIGIRNILFALGISNTVGEHEVYIQSKHYIAYRIFVTGDAAKILYKLIDYREPCPTSLNLTGKVDKYIYIDSDYVYIRVESVEDSGYHGVVYDYEIEEAHSFCGLTVVLHNTPFTGSRVMYYTPNWVRRTQSQYEYTDTLYGSEEEYFAHAPYPTPRFPLAPLRHFITDPYHWELKHYEDRPYLLTGGLAELEEFPLIGPLLNFTIGQILKPQRRMHPEIWEEIEGKDTKVYIAGSVNDPMYESQWHMQTMQMEKAWENVAGSRPQDVIVAVLDTGVDMDHPDLKPNLLPGYNVYTNDSNVQDVQGHGTHVAGIIAAVGNNAQGVVGGAYPVVKILPVKVLNDWGLGGVEDIERGIKWATNWRGPNGERVDIINMSLGSDNIHFHFDEEIRAANEAGILVVAAAGNSNLNHVGSPAITPEVLATGAVDEQLRRASYSNYGYGLDIMGPGSNILSTYPDDNYNTLSGTSMAAPFVSSVAALLKAQQPDLTPAEMRYIMQGTVYDAGEPGWDPEYGSGIINPVAVTTVDKEVDTPEERAQIRRGGRAMEEQIAAERRELMEQMREKARAAAVSALAIYDEYNREIKNPVTAEVTALQIWENIKEFGGFYGFSTELVYDTTGLTEPQIATARAMYSYRRGFWDVELGGLPGDINEIARRFIGKREKWENRYNPIPNQMPDWLPGEDYFTDFQHGDPFCLSKNTLVDVETGFKRAEEITVGELILTHKGRRLPVKAIVKRPILKNEKAYSITISGLANIPLEFSEGHPILIKKMHKCSFGSSCLCRPNVRNYNGFCNTKNCTNKWATTRLEFIEAKNIKVGDAVVYPIPIIDNQVTTLSYSYQWSDAPRSPYYTVIGDLLLTRDTSWLLGLYCAKGSTAKQEGRPVRLIFSLNAAETDVIDRVSKILYNLSGKYPTLSTRNNNTDIVLCDAKLARIFDSIVPGNLYQKRVPLGIFSSARDVRLSFILGFILGGGSVQRNYLIGTSRNRELALDIYKLCLSIGVPASYTERSTRVSYEVSIHAFNLRNEDLSDLMYKETKIARSFNRQPNIRSWSDGRYIYSLVTAKEEIQLDYVYGFEVDEDDTFCVIGFATHNTKIRRGEMRLPGEAYETLYPDTAAAVEAALADPRIRQALEQGLITREDLYDPISRLRILADVAPWSKEYREQSKYVTAMRKTKEQQEEVREIRQQVRERNKPIRMYDYRFTYGKTKKETVTVTKVVDDWDDSHEYFIYTKEYPDHPIKLAGMHVPMGKDRPEARRYLNERIKPGQRITIEYTADELHKFNDDTYETISAVVYSGRENLNLTLIREGLVDEKVKDFSPAGVAARFSEAERMVGRAWEKFAHMDTPFHTKLLQVRSPVEQYHRRDLYGKDWQEWQDPWSDFIVPTFQSIMAKGPLVGTLFGASLGRMAGVTPFGRLMGTIIGGLTGGISGAYFSGYELFTGQTWVPERRRREWEVNEYYDMLRYIKNLSLYNKYAQLSLEREEFNVKEYLKEKEEQKQATRERIYELEDAKRAIKATVGKVDVDYWKEKLGLEGEAKDARELVKLINKELTRLKAPKEEEKLPPLATKALEYYKESRRTMYGHRSGDPYAELLSAIPKKERKYLQGFIEAPPEEREKVKDTLSPYMRRIVERAWGEKPEPKPGLVEYFRTHFLPDPEWGGWREDVNLDDVKVKYIKIEGLDPSEFDVWPDDEAAARQPDVPPAPKINVREKAEIVGRKLRAILGGAGIEAEVLVEPNNTGQLDIEAEVVKDMRQELADYVNQYGSLVLS